MYILDTNAIIYYLNNEAIVVSILKDILKQDVPIFISAITEVELLSYPGLSAHEERLISSLLDSVSIIPLDSRIAASAGHIKRTYKLKIADSIIAATARFSHSVLVTRNIKDFKTVPDLGLLKI